MSGRCWRAVRKGEAVFGHFIGWRHALGAVADFDFDLHGRKIALMKLFRAIQIVYCFQNVFMQLAKMFGNNNRRGFDFTVDNGNVGTEFGCYLGVHGYSSFSAVKTPREAVKPACRMCGSGGSIVRFYGRCQHGAFRTRFVSYHHYS